jgi:hypothetical protein
VACLEVLVAKNTYNEGEGAVVRQGHLIAVVASFLMGCAVLVVVGCAGVRSGTPREEQGHTQATTEQERSPEATASEEARCEGTRTFQMKGGGGLFSTNDVPGCPTGGLLSGTDGRDNLDGKKGEDEIHGLGGVDVIFGGDGSDVIYGGPGDDSPLWGGRGDDVIYGGDGGDPDLWGGPGEDVVYGGDGNDFLEATFDRQRDKIYCGAGRDTYLAGKEDFVDSSCEKKAKVGPPIP